MNCLLEAAASVWLGVRRSDQPCPGVVFAELCFVRRVFDPCPPAFADVYFFLVCLSWFCRGVVTEQPEEEVMTAQEGLEQCRRNMEGREHELLLCVSRLTEEAVAKKRAGDLLSARSKVQERRRVQKRLERLRHGLDLVDTQLDAIKTSELDKEIMLTIKASTSAMRKAGITLGVQEVENVMSELDEQMREVQDITDVLANPAVMLSGTEEADLDAELDLLEAVGDGMIPQPLADPHPAPR